MLQASAFSFFCYRNLLRATAACTFGAFQLRKMLRQWCTLHALISKHASRHSRAHRFHLSTCKSVPNTAGCIFLKITSDGSAPATLASLLFDAPEHKNIREKILFRDFSIFLRALIFFLRNLSLLTSLLWLLSRLLFNLSILSEVWLLSFLRYPFIVLIQSMIIMNIHISIIMII